MKSYYVTVSDEREKALKVIAQKDNTTTVELVQKQIDYYCGTVIDKFISQNEDLTTDERILLKDIIAHEKAKIIAKRK